MGSLWRVDADWKLYRKEGYRDITDDMADAGRSYHEAIWWYADNIISDEAKKNKSWTILWWVKAWLATVWDWILWAWWDIVWWIVWSVASAPKMVRDIWHSFTYENVGFNTNTISEKMDEAKAEWHNNVWAFFQAIAEWNEEWDLSSQAAYQILNNPLVSAWIWKAIKWWWKWISWLARWIWKVDDIEKWVEKTSKVIWWTTNIADDSVKSVNQTTKQLSEVLDPEWFVKAETKADLDDLAKWLSKESTETAENLTKTSPKAVETVPWKLWSAKDFVKSKLSKPLKSLWEAWIWVLEFLSWPLWVATRQTIKAIKTAKNAKRLKVVAWITDLVWEWVQSVWWFFESPIYRMWQWWSMNKWNQYIGNNVRNYYAQKDSQKFREDNWYIIENYVFSLNEEQLKARYDKDWIPEDKRYTLDELREMYDNFWKNPVSDTFQTISDVFDIHQIFSAPWAIRNAQQNTKWDFELNDRERAVPVNNDEEEQTHGAAPEKDPDEESADEVIQDEEMVKDQNIDTIIEYLESQWIEVTEEKRKELEKHYDEFEKMFEEAYERQMENMTDEEKEQTEKLTKAMSEYTWLEPNNITNAINWYAYYWMLTPETEKKFIEWVNTSWIHNYLIDITNEASRQYTMQVVNMFTPEAINDNVDIQKDILETLQIWRKAFNYLPDIINNEDIYNAKDFQNDPEYFEDAMWKAVNKLSAEEQAVLYQNLYAQAVDYNNSLDWVQMEFVTWWRRNVSTRIANVVRDDPEIFFKDQWLNWFANELINPQTKWWRTGIASVRASLNENSETLLEDMSVNMINHYIEKWVQYWWKQILRNHPNANTRLWNWLVWAASEMSSELLENQLDALAAIYDPSTDSGGFPWFVIGLIQAWIAWYWESDTNYKAVQEYFNDPKNREQILLDAWYDLNAIEDPQLKAEVLSLTAQLFDDIMWIAQDVAENTNNWVENFAQWWINFVIRKESWEFWQKLVNDAVNIISTVTDWTDTMINNYFDSKKDFQNFLDWKQFKFSQSFIDQLKSARSDEYDALKARSQALIKWSFEVANMSLQDAINYLAPKVYANGERKITPLQAWTSVEEQYAKAITWNYAKDELTGLMMTLTNPWTIWTRTWMTSNNKKVWNDKTNSFKKKVNVNWKDMTMSDYIIHEIINNEHNDPGVQLTDNERDFIATVLFKSTVSGLNLYFEPDWSLTKMWEDFFKQVLPTFREYESKKLFLDTLIKAQIAKEVAAQQSERDALRASEANTETLNSIKMSWWENIKSWDDISLVNDKQSLMIKKWKDRITMKTLKDAWKITVYEKWNTSTKTIITVIDSKMYIDRVDLLPSDIIIDTLSEDDMKNVYVFEEKWQWTVTVDLTNDRQNRSTNVPISAEAEDYPDLATFTKPTEFLEWWNTIKWNIPYLPQSKVTVWIEIPDISDQHETPEQANAMKFDKETLASYPDVTIETSEKDAQWNPVVKKFKAVWLKDFIITDQLSKSDWKKRDFEFKALVLVDVEHWETISFDYSKVIRPSAYPKDKAYYSDNNKYAIVKDKNWKEISENRILTFTRWEDWIWNLSSTIQADRLSPTQFKKAFDNNAVFMNDPKPKPEDYKKWYLWSTPVEYDARNIYTLSDMVFDPTHEYINIFWMRIPVFEKSYNSNELRWAWDTTQSLKDFFTQLWDKQQLKKSTTSEPKQETKQEEKQESPFDEVVGNMEPVWDKSASEVKEMVTDLNNKAEEQYNAWMKKVEEANKQSSVTTSKAEDSMIILKKPPKQESLFDIPTEEQIEKVDEQAPAEMTPAEEALTQDLTEDQLPEPEEIIEKKDWWSYKVLEDNFWDKLIIQQIINDCELYWINVDLLDASHLSTLIYAYSKWLWIDYVIEKFVSDMPWSVVDRNIINKLISAWILRRWATYEWKTLSAIVNEAYMWKFTNETVLTKMVDPKKLNEKMWWLVFRAIADYYISQHFWLNPERVSKPFRSKVEKLIKNKFLNSNIYFPDKQKTVLTVTENQENDYVLELQQIPAWIRTKFATEAYNAWLISNAKYVAIMWENPNVLTVWKSEEDYDFNNIQIWPIGWAIIKWINQIPWFWKLKDPKCKLRLFLDVYNYFTIARSASYNWLIKYLDKKYDQKGITDKMKPYVDILREDAAKSANPVHSATVMKELKVPYVWDFEWNPYNQFVWDETNKDVIVEAFIELEKSDYVAFVWLMRYTPTDIRNEIYNQFVQDNLKDHWSNIAYWMVSKVIPNYDQVKKQLVRNSRSKTRSTDVQNMLRNFNSVSLISPVVTQQLYNQLWINWLDLNRWTVILTNNYNDSYGKWMQNFDNVISFPVFPVNELWSIDADVNVIVPHGVTVPKKFKWKIREIHLPDAWYHDWMLVFNDWSKSAYNMQTKIFNQMWLAWVWITANSKFRLTEQHKKVIEANKTNKSLYWNIFKNNVMFNLDEASKAMTQEQFESMIDPDKLKDVSMESLMHAFVWWSVDEIVSTSVAIINFVTDNKMKLTYDWGNQFSIEQSSDEFIKFVNEKIASEKDRAAVLDAYAAFSMMWLSDTKQDIDQWFDDFLTNHNRAIQVLNQLFSDEVTSEDSLYQIFFSWKKPHTSETIFVDKNYIKQIWKQQRDIAIQKLQTAKDEYEVARWQEQLKRANDILERDEVEVIDYEEEAPNQEEINNLNSQLDTARNNLQELYLKKRPDQKRIKALTDYINQLEDKLNELQNNIYWEEWQYVTIEWWQELSYEEQSDTSIETESYSNQWWYTDNWIKALASLKKRFITPFLYSTTSTKATPIWKSTTVSKNLLPLITWEWLFENQRSLSKKWESKPRSQRTHRKNIRNSDLVITQQILVTAKANNEKWFNKLLDTIFQFQEEVSYAYDSEQNRKIKNAKDLVRREPLRFYAVMNDLLSDWTLWIDVLYDSEYQTSTAYKWIQTDWLMAAMTSEFLTTRPKPLDKKWVAEARKKYGKYFKQKDWTILKASDEQITVLASLIDAYNNRSKWWTVAFPWVAWAWKTTVLWALFNYITSEWGWYKSEVANILNWQQRVLIKTFNTPWYLDALKKIKDEKPNEKWEYPVHYVKVKNKTSNDIVYVEFTAQDLISREEIEKDYWTTEKQHDKFYDKYNKLYWGKWPNWAIWAIAKVWEWSSFKSTNERTRWIRIRDNAIRTEIPKWTKTLDVIWDYDKVSSFHWENSPKNIEYEAISWVKDVEFATRMNSTAWSIRDVFVKNMWMDWVITSTISSFFTQPDKSTMNTWWYRDTPILKKEVHGKVIIIDEAQNAYDQDLKAMVDQLSKDNIVVFMWDRHQNTKSDFFQKEVWKKTIYMTDTFRWTDDINLINIISSFVQWSLTDANAIWLYMTDSDSFVQYDWVDNIPFDWPVWDTLMVCQTNEHRNEMNMAYLNKKWWLKQIRDKWTPLQMMIVDILWSKEKSQSQRKSELYAKWVSIKSYKDMNIDWHTIFYNTSDKNRAILYVPISNTTDTSDPLIAKAIKAMQNMWYGKDWKELYVMTTAFAITTEKESWKTVKNIILHEDVVDSSYDYLSEKNVKMYYDAFTRWAEKVYIPKNSTRLIWISREQAQWLVEWKWLTEVTIYEPNQSQTETETFNLPIINNGKTSATWKISDIANFIWTLMKGAWIEWEDRNELLSIIHAANKFYLQQVMTPADAEYYNKAWGYWVQSYSDWLKQQIANIWEKHKENIIKYVSSQHYEENAEDLELMLFKITEAVYWQKISIPYEKTEWENAKDWWNKPLIYAKKRLTNRTIEWDPYNKTYNILLDSDKLWWQIYEPVTVTENWVTKTILKPLDVRWKTKTIKWWLAPDQRMITDWRVSEYKNIIQSISKRREVLTPEIWKKKKNKDWTITSEWDTDTASKEALRWFDRPFVEATLLNLRDMLDEDTDKLDERLLYRETWDTELERRTVLSETLDEDWSVMTDDQIEKAKDEAAKMLWMSREEYDRTHPDAWKVWAEKTYSIWVNAPVITPTALKRKIDNVIDRIDSFINDTTLKNDAQLITILDDLWNVVEDMQWLANNEMTVWDYEQNNTIYENVPFDWETALEQTDEEFNCNPM